MTCWDLDSETTVLNPVHWILCLESDSQTDGSQILVMILRIITLCWNSYFTGFLEFSFCFLFIEIFYVHLHMQKSTHISSVYSSMNFHNLNTPVYISRRSSNRTLLTAWNPIILPFSHCLSWLSTQNSFACLCTWYIFREP